MNFGVPTRRVRILVQGAVFALWVALICLTRHPIDHWLTQWIPVSLFLRMDPLVTTVVCGGLRMGVTILLLGVVTIVVSFLLGRVFCGWVCPLGTLFDFFGWFLRRAGVSFEGPSPWYFRFKYYFLISLLIFAIFGGVSPLMGFDPIVLLTRTAAVVVYPLFRLNDPAVWLPGSELGYYGYFIDFSTLILFGAILFATTRLSRFWCRTTCPLGAYLGVISRNSVLRRETDECIHCNLCAIHCPTGAIDFKDERFYNESECIKCFSCSQECPVDANYFTLKSPVPATTATYEPVSLDRRAVLFTSLGTLMTAPFLKLASGAPESKKKLIRPPMSRPEKDFLLSCIRCSECIKACPTGILKSSGLENGIRALWSPVMVPTEGPCLSECQACAQACPTDAILKYPLEEKYSYKAGTAYLDSSRCISYGERKFCSECIRACPTNAIEFTPGWKPEGGLGADTPAPEGEVPERPVSVSFEKCIGCGACEYECNKIVIGVPAMITTSYGRTIPSDGVRNIVKID